MAIPRRFAALDTQFLLDLENGDANCAEAVDILNQWGFYFIVTGTVLQELEDIACEEESQIAGHARDTLKSITNWSFITPELPSVQNGVAEIVALRLIERQLLPSAQKNDGLVIVEAAIHGCQVLLSPRKPIVDAKSDSLRLALIESDVSGVIAIRPLELIAYSKFEKANGAKKQ